MDIISTAQAAEAVAPQGGGIAELGMIVVFVAVFYFLLWRPQSKRQKEHTNLIGALQKGDEVVTNGGLVGKIAAIKDDFLTVNIAEGVEITLQRFAVSSVLPKGTMKSIS